jgi:hypothetical protein
MANTFTAGPWRVSADGIWARSPWNAQVKIATVTVCSPMNGIDWEANAKLMAAAPALLTALHACAGALHLFERHALIDPDEAIKFTSEKWAHLGTKTLTEILDQANTALGLV